MSTHPLAETSGPRAHVLGTLRGFRAAGWEVRPWILGDLLGGRFARHALEARAREGRTLRRIGALGRWALARMAGPIAARSVGSDVDWAYERCASFFDLGRSIRRRGVPWILETNGIFHLEALEDRRTLALAGLARRIEERAYRECDVLVAVTPVLRELAIERVGVDPSKVIVCPNAVDVSRFARVPERRPREDGRLVIGFVGGLASWQRLDRLLAVAARLLAEGLDLEIRVAGDGPGRRPWEELARELGIADRVKFHGHLAWEEVPGFLERIDLGYAGPEPGAVGEMYHSPLKLYEYLAAGRPFLAADYDDARRLQEESRSGFLFVPARPESLEASLRRAFAARESLPALGRRGRRHVAARHTWERRIAWLIEQIAARTAGAGGRKSDSSGSSSTP